MSETHRNWAGNITYGAERMHTPRTVAEVQEIIRGAKVVRGLGSRHSFNRIADTDADLVSMRGLDRILNVDKAAGMVTVEAGIPYGELAAALHAEGLALHNLASLPHISVAGAIATATHGSGDHNGNLATIVTGLEFVNAGGEIVAIRRGDADFEGAVVSLGGLGLVTSVTLEVMPTFDVRQDVYLDLPFAAVLSDFDAITASAYSVSLFTSWQGDTVDQVWLKSRADAEFGFAGGFFGARPAGRAYHPITALAAEPCTEQMGVAGPWSERLAHFRMEFKPSAGEELQSEYFVARSDAVRALDALRGIAERIAPLLMISEIRTVAADNLWMSMMQGRESVGLHFTWKQDWPAVRALLPAVEAALAPFAARPHWGKLFTMPPADVQARYPKLADFRQLLTRHDPGGKFRNAFVDEHVF